VKIRELCEADIPAVERILEIAFGRPMGPLAMRIRLAPVDWLAAEVDGAPAGVVSARRYGGLAYIGMMAVDPERQRRGIGRALMQAIVARLQRAGISTFLLDATDQGAPLYEKFGFRTYDWTHYYERPAELRSGLRIPPAVSTHDLREAIALDREFYGCDRSEMLALLAREPGAMLTVAVDGYLMARETSIGPFVAESDETARDLFEAALARRRDLIRGWAPGLNPAARRLFEDAGFPLVRSVRHMARGVSPFRRERIFSQASHGHG
jgi:predicted N-acetyltransferase YhbS